MQTNLDLWEQGLRTSGGALSADKSRWTFIDFSWKNGEWKYMSQSQLPGQLLMRDVSGERRQLTRLEPWEAERALGVRLAPDGNMKIETQYHLAQAHQWAAQMILHKASRYSSWINFSCVLMKRLEYPLMATTLSRADCDAIIKPALKVALPAIGLNRHFPRQMVYGHNDHHGLGVPHLYDTQGYRHLLAMMQFGSSLGTTGTLLQHSYEALQLELGLPGEIFKYCYTDWATCCTPTWLTHTWQYCTENGIVVKTGITPLSLQCENDQFLTQAFWNHGYRGKQLALLNQCRIWLQATTLADLVDGYGTSLLAPLLAGNKTRFHPSPYKWPQQGQLPSFAWLLWREAIQRTFPTRTGNHLATSLGPWLLSSDVQKWFWNDTDLRLFEQHLSGWKVWIPCRCTRYYGGTFKVTDLQLS